MFPRQEMDNFAMLDGKTAVVTGSGSGIGQAIALELARAGADVFVHARANRDGASQTRDAIIKMGRRSDLRLADFGDDGDFVQALEDAAFAWSPSVDLFVNAAGADVLTGNWAKQSLEAKLQHLLKIDVEGTVRLSRRFGSRMKSGSIVTVGWDQAAWGMEGDSGQVFATTKSAVMAFTKSLAKSLAPRVRVNCVAPGWIQTAWGSEASEPWQRRAASESLLERWGRVEDVANVVRFLCSDAAAFVNGQIVNVNGGYRTGAR